MADLRRLTWKNVPMDGGLNYANIRPYATPDSLDGLSGPAGGVVVLPGWLDWGPRRSYDLDDSVQRRVMYEQVIQEGRVRDIETYLNSGLLIAGWVDLILPARVRAAWESRFVELRARAA
jgi:hypothetical protein